MNKEESKDQDDEIYKKLPKYCKVILDLKKKCTPKQQKRAI